MNKILWNTILWICPMHISQNRNKMFCKNTCSLLPKEKEIYMTLSRKTKQNRESTKEYSRFKVEKRHGKFRNTGLNICALTGKETFSISVKVHVYLMYKYIDDVLSISNTDFKTSGSGVSCWISDQRPDRKRHCFFLLLSIGRDGDLHTSMKMRQFQFPYQKLSVP